MDNADYLALIGKITQMEAGIKELKARVKELETNRSFSWLNGDAERLLEVYPFMMSKSEAAKVLGVSRCTVYLMIKDGRLCENSDRKIPTRSVIDYIYIKKGGRN